MSKNSVKAGKDFRRALLVPTLMISTFLVFSNVFFFSTLLVNLALSFKVSIGTVSELAVVYGIMGLIVGLAISAIALRFKHKSLLLLSTLLFAAGMFAYSFAQNIGTVTFLTFVLGGTAAVINSMVYTLIGEQLPLEKRGLAAGLVQSSIMSAAVIVAAVAGFIASYAGWRMVPLWFIFPLSLVSLVLGFTVIPSKQPQPQASQKPSYRQALKKIFLNRSPMACCLGTLLAATTGAVPVYAVSFFRIVHGVSSEVGGVMFSVAALGGVVGGTIGGRMVNRFGRRPLAIWTCFVAGISCILFTYIPILAIAVAVWTVNSCAVAMTWAGLPSLTLEQVPEYRASMMSIYTAFDNAGTILIIVISGLVLNLFSNNFHLVMIISGALVAFAGVILLLFSKDAANQVPLTIS